jgi:hypothetical protein
LNGGLGAWFQEIGFGKGTASALPLEAARIVGQLPDFTFSF